MKARNKKIIGAMIVAAGALLSATASATAIPVGWTCNGNCGSDVADGVVALPTGVSSYQWASTEGGATGAGALPSGALGHETNGSTLATSLFSVNAGTLLNFNFNYVTSDGANYSDYGWAALFDSSHNLASLLFTARTKPDGSIVPGFGMPDVNATLTPVSVAIIGGAPQWSPLGGSSNLCYSGGCGYTGWVNANYTIADAGDYYLEMGVTNWSDTAYQTGLAMYGVTVNGAPVGPAADVPEPSALGMFGLGALLIGLALATRRRMA